MDKIKELLDKEKNKIFNIAIIILALFFSYNINKSQTRKLVLLRQSEDGEIEKNVILEKIKESERKVSVYKAFINNKDISLITSTISEIAEKNPVAILSMRPLQPEDNPLYIKYPFNLKFETEDYHTIGKFISQLENHPDIYTLEEIRIIPQSTTLEEVVTKLNVDLKISTVLLKD